MSNVPQYSVSSLPTPHAPGFFPETPAADAYTQNEGPLEQAGRSLHPNEPQNETNIPVSHAASLAPVILATGAGMILGGPIGAAAAGFLSGAGQLEDEGLKKGLGHTDTPNHQLKANEPKDAVVTSSASSATSPGTESTSSTIHDVTEEKTQAALAASPAQQMLGSDAKHDLSALMAGGAGAAVVDKELEEPTTDLSAETKDPAVSNVIPDSASPAASTTTEATQTEPLEAEATQRELTDKEKYGLAGAAGLGAGGLAGALASRGAHENTETKDPAVSNVIPNPASPAASTMPEATQTEPLKAETTQRELTDKEKYGVAGAAGLGAGGLAGALAGHEAHENTIRESSGATAGQPVLAAPLTSGGAEFAQSSTTPVVSTSASHKFASEAEPKELEPQQEKEGMSGKEKAALAGGAGLGAGGLAAAALGREEHEKTINSNNANVVPSKSDATANAYPAQRDGDAITSTSLQPVAAASDPPVGSYHVPSISEKAREAAVPGQIETVSGTDRARELNADDGGSSSTSRIDPTAGLAVGGLAPTAVAQALKEDPHALSTTQLEHVDPKKEAIAEGEATGVAVGGVAAFAVHEALEKDPQALSPEHLQTSEPAVGHEASGQDHHNLAAAAGGAAVGGAAAVAVTEAMKHDSEALSPERLHDVNEAPNHAPHAGGVDSFDDQRAVLHDHSHPAAAGVLGAGVGAGAGAVAADGQQAPREQGLSTNEKVLAGTAATGGVGLGAATLTRHNQSLAAEQHPGIASNNSLQRVLNDSQTNESSYPSSTRAMKGSPTGTPQLESSVNQQPDLYPEQHPTGGPSGAGVPIMEQSSADAQREFLERHPDVHPVEKSPHMKIATHVDSSGHKRLHKKSLGDVIIPGSPESNSRHSQDFSSTPPQDSHESRISQAQAHSDYTPDQQRRDHITDRMVGVQDSTTGTSPRQSTDVHRKLTKNRRPSKGEEMASPKKQGFFSKLLGKDK